MKWLALLPELLNRIPLEKLITRPLNNTKRLRELQGILGFAEPKKVEGPITDERAKVHLEPRTGELSTEETVTYQNREIGKMLLRMEEHCTQKFRLFGKICDCGAQKHILNLESLCEETIPMVDNPNIYYQIIDLGTELTPKCLPEAVATLEYDIEFPSYAHRYRDLRKNLIGSIDVTEIEKPDAKQYFPEEVKVND